MNRDLLNSLGSAKLTEDRMGNEREYEGLGEELKENGKSSQFWAYVAKKCKEHMNSSLPSVEYEKLKERESFIDRENDVEEGKLEIHQHKNRYGNILPYEQTRVKLRTLEHIKGSDYINANFVGINSEYIAAQAPTPQAFSDFWRMAYECNCKIIVMLTKEYEGNKLKSHRYWPDDGQIEFGEITVKLVNQENMIDYIRRDFTLHKKGTESIHTISHFHYLAWPDQGVPTEPQTLLRIIKEVNSIKDNFCDDQSPSIIHCSAGVGRTGAYIVIDSKLKELHQLANNQCDIPSISVMDYLKVLRNQRCGMVTQKTQYLFCYEVLLAEAVTRCGIAPSDQRKPEESDGYDSYNSD